LHPAGFQLEAKVTLASNEAVETTRLRLVNLEQRDRTVTIATLREWVLNETGWSKGTRRITRSTSHMVRTIARRDLRAEPAAERRRAQTV